MSPDALSCMTCRMIRRFILAFVVGGVIAWQVTGTLPFAVSDPKPLQGMVGVVILFSFLSVFMRMKNMRRRWQK